MSKQVKCVICKSKELSPYSLYEFSYVVNNKILHEVGIKKIIEDLDLYAFRKGYHLSGSQILLLRQDILEAFILEDRVGKKNKISNMKLTPARVCNEHFLEYCSVIPLK